MFLIFQSSLSVTVPPFSLPQMRASGRFTITTVPTLDNLSDLMAQVGGGYVVAARHVLPHTPPSSSRSAPLNPASARSSWTSRPRCPPCGGGADSSAGVSGLPACTSIPCLIPDLSFSFPSSSFASPNVSIKLDLYQSDGKEIYMQRQPGMVGRTFSEARRMFEGATLCGLVNTKTGAEQGCRSCMHG